MVPQDIRIIEHERVSAALRDFYWRSHRLVDRLMSERGASWAQTRVLAEIAKQGPMRSIDLAACFGLAPRTVTEAIDGLERDGLARRDPDPDDRRAKRISLTLAGEDAAAQAEAARLRYVENVFGVLDPPESAEIVRLLAKLNDRLEALVADPR